MTDTTYQRPEEPALGVGTIFTETFGLFFRRIHIFALLAFLPSVALEAFDFFVTQQLLQQLDVYGDPDAWARNLYLYAALSVVSAFVGTSLAVAMVAQAAYDARLGHRARIGHYIASALRGIVPIVVLAVGLGVVLIAGFVLLIAPGLWLMGLWSLVNPAIVIERAGFRAVSRSHALTLGYRWPVVGALLLIYLMIALIGAVIAVPVVAMLGIGTSGGPLSVLSFAEMGSSILIGMVQFGLSGVCLALTYARLREIKEGLPTETLEDVFG